MRTDDEAEKSFCGVVVNPMVPEPIFANDRLLSMLVEPLSMANTLWLQAVSHSRADRLDEAAHAFGQFLTLVPDHATAHYNLAVTLKALNRLDEAAHHYRRTLVLDPANAKAHNNLAVILAADKRFGEAIKHYEHALELNPDYANAHYNLANSLIERGDTEGAISHYQNALATEPNDAEISNNLGIALMATNQIDDALAQFQQALTLRPGYIEAYNNLGSAFDAQGRVCDAIATFQATLKLDPRHADAYYNLGHALDAQARWTEAQACYERALALDPTHAEAHNNLGLLSQRFGRWDEALARYDRAQGLKPDYADAHWNEALTRLRLGDFALGWRKYEWRWRRKATPPRLFTAPVWDGGSLTGKTILIHVEQGHGDAIQFIRYAAVVKALGATVIVECPKALDRLFSTVAGVDQLVCTGEAPPAFDVHAPLLGLPLRLGTRADFVPALAPYLSADLGTAAIWQARLEGLAGRKVGLVWRGNPAHSEDRLRSMEASTLAPLVAGLKGTTFVSLQVDARPEEFAALSPTSVVDAGAMLDDWTDTAALLSTLDLVITVDTAVAHLAGALGKSVWVLLPSLADWRWLLDRADSPWYPTMRLFRQPSLGDWTSVVREVRKALESVAQNADLSLRAGRPPASAPRPAARRLPPVMVVSHERSGTHFLMNGLSYAYGYTAQPWVDLDIHNVAVDLSNSSRMAASLASLTSDALFRIVKSHHAVDAFGDELPQITDAFTILYIYRNPSAVMTSLWRHLNGLDWDEGPKLDDPLALARAAPTGRLTRYQVRSSRTMLRRWAAHVEGWLSHVGRNPRIIPVRYEELDQNYEGTLGALSGVIGRDPIEPWLRPMRDVNVIAVGRSRLEAPTTPAMRVGVEAFCVAELEPLLRRLGYTPQR